MSIAPVIKFMFRTEWKVLADALALNPIYESMELGSANDLSNYLNAPGSGGLIVTSLYDKNDLIQLATFMKQVKRSSTPTCMKVLVINFSGDKQFEKAVGKLGILDIVEPSIQTKALKFKIDFMMKSVNVQLKKLANTATGPAAVKSLENNKTQEKKVQENSPVWESPLDCEDDIWLLKNDQDCKKVLTRWLIKLMGPSPYVAQWVESETSGVWKFEFKGENDFIFGKGHWYFRGDQKPDFIWSENTWSFTGSAFDLFYKEGESVFSRLKLKDRVLTIAKNSEFAKTKERSIAESFDKDLVFKKEGTQAAEADVLETEQEKYKNLEGKGKTDSLNQGPLSGKGKTSNINTDPMSMDLNPGENNSSSNPLTQKGNPSKSSSFWKGKNEYSQDGQADLSQEADQNAGEGSELGLEGKNQVQKYYKNHNEAEKFDAKDIGHAIKKDGVSDNLRGKTSTDEIEGHLTSPDAKKQKAQVEKPASDLKGKTSTDKLPGHLTSADSKKETPAADKPAGEMRGKASTDNLPGHLSSPVGNKELPESKAPSRNAQTPGIYTDQDESQFDEAGTQKDLQELKEALNSNKKGRSTQKSSGGTDHLSAHYSSAQNKANRESASGDENNVLPFNKEGKQPSDTEVLPPGFDEAIMTAKVTSYLSQDSVNVLCHLDDHFDQTIIFVTEEKGLAAAKTVKLNLNFNYMNKDTNLKFDGNVMQVEADDEGTHYVTVEISRENVSAFNSFMKLYETRQNNINHFLKTVKGL